jgi:hypothetical protein
MTTNPVPTTCTVGPSAVTGERCGKPAVTTFIGTDGITYAECVEHASPSALTSYDHGVHHKVIKTASKAPYALVARDRIVGYAHSTGPAVVKRAANLGARLVPIIDGEVRL